MKHAVLLFAAFAVACATERPQLTASDAFNPDAPVASAQQSNALAQRDDHDHDHDEATAAAVYACPMHPEVRASSPDARCPKCGMKLEPVAKKEPSAAPVYACPMHPEVTQDHPGSCPKCGMKLEQAPGDAGTAVYACPMHPEVVGTSADQRCPKCNMKLERRK